MDKGTVFIAKIKFRRDPSQNVKARQFVVIDQQDGYLRFLETESVLKKRKFNDANIKNSELRYFILSDKESRANGFKEKTAINCYEIFKCRYFDGIHLLKHRELSGEVLSHLIDKVMHVHEQRLNIDEVLIEENELRTYNKKLQMHDE